MKKNLVLILIFLSISGIIFADETDNFTYSKVDLEDSTQILNDKFNYYLQMGIADANKEEKGSDKKNLYKSIKKYITDKIPETSIVRDIYSDNDMDLIHITKKNSIYSNWTLRNGMSLGKDGTFIAGIINYNGTQIGMDKLEHIFRTGRILFAAWDRGWEFENVMKLSYFMERWLLGGNRIGASIISYGDLAANFNGVRLWNDFLKNYPDPLGRELGPYIAYIDGMWILQETVDLRNYIDDSLDERINSSIFSHKSSTEKFSKNVEEAKEKGLVEKSGYSENKEIVDELVLKYGEYADYIINNKE